MREHALRFGFLRPHFSDARGDFFEADLELARGAAHGDRLDNDGRDDDGEEQRDERDLDAVRQQHEAAANDHDREDDCYKPSAGAPALH